MQIDFFNGQLNIWAEKTNELGLLESVKLNLYKNQITKAGFYNFPFPSFPSTLFFSRFNNEWYQSNFDVNKNLSAKVLISRIDTINYYMAGTFSFTLFDETGTSQVNITEGRFDYKYH